MIEGPIWLVGCGNMAGAMLEGWVRAGVPAERFTVIRPSGAEAAPGVRTLKTPPRDGAVPAMAMLGVKPQKLDEVAPKLAPLLRPETLLISILAGVEIASLRQRFAAPAGIVRAMPNLPVRLGKGATGIIASGASAEQRAEITALIEKLGLAEWVETEAELDAVSVLAGSGPAFVYRFIDALAAAGAGIGLSHDRARRLALATVEGAGLLAAGASETPEKLADRVASPGGSTRKGLDVLDRDRALAMLVERTLAASRDCVAQMAAEARGGVRLTASGDTDSAHPPSRI